MIYSSYRETLLRHGKMAWQHFKVRFWEQVVQELQQVLVLGESLEALEVKADILDVQDILVDVKWIA